MSDITHSLVEVLNDEMASRAFDLTPDERASVIVALRHMSKDFQACLDNVNTPPARKRHFEFFIEQARSVIEKLGFQGV